MISGTGGNNIRKPPSRLMTPGKIRRGQTTSKKQQAFRANAIENDKKRVDRYDIREWRQLKDVGDMTSESNESIVDSQNGDNDSDYLMAGLNWAHEGNYTNLPQETQAKIKKQKEKARIQGSFKYIAPLKG